MIYRQTVIAVHCWRKNVILEKYRDVLEMIAMYRFLKYMNNLNKPIIFQNYEYQLINDI